MTNLVFSHGHGRLRVERDRVAGLKVYDDREALNTRGLARTFDLEASMAKRFRFGLDSAVLVALIGILSGVIGAYATAAATSRATLRQNTIELR